MTDPRYAVAFRDWLACAYAGRDHPAVAAARSLPGPGGTGPEGAVLAVATAGHVLDFDDTYAPGLAHLSAPTAPAALVVGADLDAPVAHVLAAYAAGFEAMGALTEASHPALYDGGWHPTAVCGAVGAATAAAHLLGISADADPERLTTAQRLAILGAGGLRAAFGSDGKSLQVAGAAATGIRAARLAAAGVTIATRVANGFAATYGGRWVVAPPAASPQHAVEGNWIKAYPCCLQTHSTIEAADRLRNDGIDLDVGPDVGGTGHVVVHPRSRQAAGYDDVTTGLEAKFSIPYTAAFTLLHHAPTRIEDFAAVEPRARALARRIEVHEDASLGESEARMEWRPCAGATMEARCEAATGSPQRPMSSEQLGMKTAALTDGAFDGMLEAGGAARDLLAVLSRD